MMRRAATLKLRFALLKAGSVLDMGATCMPRRTYVLNSWTCSPEEAVMLDWANVGEDFERASNEVANANHVEKIHRRQ